MKLKKYISFILLICVFLSNRTFAARKVVLIDPGHGGEELGALGQQGSKHEYMEKNLALIFAKEIARSLEGKVDVFLTRSLDRTITLQERSKIVDKIGADLFISVHMNSSEDKNSSGFETYYLDNKNDSAVKKVVDTENAKSDLPEEIQLILTDLVVHHTVDSSKNLASSIHRHLSKKLPAKFRIKDRGIKRGLFYVLALAKVPGVLLECGFLSNPNEALLLNREDYQREYAQAVAAGILEYFKNKK